MSHPLAVASVSDLRSLIQSRVSPDYAEKMLHEVPVWPTVKDRGAHLEAQAAGKVVLDIGCTGPISARVKTAAAGYYGVDARPGPWAVVDLDADPEQLPHYPDVDLVIASEVLEHLANPGRFLAVLGARYRDIDIIVTVPHAGAYTVQHGAIEVVNKDHVAWYSYTTLKTLLTRYGYTVLDCCWYNGPPHKAEGLIVLARTV